MKTKNYFYLLASSLLILINCSHPLEGEGTDPYIGPYKMSDTVKLVSDPSENDPSTIGLNISCTFTETPKTEKIEIPNDLPIFFDLSKDMPPVKSQGLIGSCASFATAYYMKSYQEKIQHGYKYDNYGKVMSPSYVYNQVKVSSDCGSGSCIEANLEVLKKQGVTTWLQFPFANECSRQPNFAERELAKVNKIKEYYRINRTDSTNANYTIAKAIKSLIFKKTPVVIGMALDKDFVKADKETDSVFIWKNYNKNKFYGNHAMLIVGYDDRLQAFKVINSWGTSWGNKGYVYISYNFFNVNEDDFIYSSHGQYYSEDL